MQEEMVAALSGSIAEESTIRAAWLGGSLGRGDADRFSDIDLHLVVAAGRRPEMAEGARQWLCRHAELVFFRSMGKGRMFRALTTDGLRIEVWLHEPGERLEGYSSAHSRVLHDPSQLLLEPTLETRAPPRPGRAERLLADIEEFWRRLSLLPAAVGRAELIAGVQGLGVELALVSRIVVDSVGAEHEARGMKLNAALPAEVRSQLEVAIAPAGHGIEGMKRAHLNLAEFVSRVGPVYAERHGFSYPSALQDAVTAYVTRELAAAG
jgi:hypothetical protein